SGHSLLHGPDRRDIYRDRSGDLPRVPAGRNRTSQGLTMRMAEQLLLALKRGGAREIFGIPGDFALPLFAAIEESGILPLYTLSHEPAAGFAADAAARYNCGLGVV